MRKSTWMEKEIQETPRVIRRFFQTQREALLDLGERLRRNPPRLVVLAARGTSDNACTFARYLIEKEWGTPVSLAAPSLLTLYRARVDYRGALVIGVSQSGEGPDVCRLVEEARAQGALTVGVTNTRGSRLARSAEHPIFLEAGKEHSVAATKTYTAQLAALSALVFCVKEEKALHRLAQDAFHAVQKGVALSQNIEKLAPRFLHLSACAVVGRGFHYGSAQEAALKLKECAKVMAHAYSTADFHHGPKTLAEHGFSVILLAPSGPTLKDSRGLLRELHQRNADVTVLTPMKTLGRSVRAMVVTPRTSEILSPLAMAPLIQTLALQVALVKGLDPDRPVGLQKVTRTQ